MTETYVFFPFQTSMSVHRQMVAVNTPVSTLTSPSTASVSKDTLSRQIKRLVKVNKTRPFCFQDQDEHFLRFNDYGADFGVLKTRFQLHYAVHDMSKKPLGLFWRFRPSTRNYNNKLYYNLEEKE